MSKAKSTRAFRTISEAADELGLQAHVLRFWESKFSDIQPMKRRGGRRFYRPEDIEFLRGIKILLHREKHPIKDVQKLIRIKGAQSVVDLGRSKEVAAQPKDIAEMDLVPKRIKPVVRKRKKAKETPPTPHKEPVAIRRMTNMSEVSISPFESSVSADTTSAEKSSSENAEPKNNNKDDIVRRVVPIDIKSRRWKQGRDFVEDEAREQPDAKPTPPMQEGKAQRPTSDEISTGANVKDTESLKDALSKLRSLKTRWEKFK